MTYALQAFFNAKAVRGARLVTRSGAAGQTLYFVGTITIGANDGWTDDRDLATRFHSVPYNVLQAFPESKTTLA